MASFGDGEDGDAVGMLREQIAMLTRQYYRDRQGWLEEKARILQDAGKGRSQPTPVSATSCSEYASDVHTDDTSQGALSARDASCSFTSLPESLSRSGSPPSTNEAAVHGSPRVVVSLGGAGPPSPLPAAAAAASGPAGEALAEELAALQRQLEESKRQSETAAARWAMEREALQRQVRALISMAEPGPSRPGSEGGAALLGAGVSAGGASVASSIVLMTHGSLPLAASEAAREAAAQAERLAELEAMVEELQHERDNLEEQLRVAATEAARAARRAAAVTASSLSPSPAASLELSNGGCAAASPRGAAPQAPLTPSTGGAASGGGAPPPSPAAGALPAAAAAFGVSWDRNLTLTDAVSVPVLLAEKAALERELRQLRAEHVAVPRAEYAELSSAKRQLAFLESEVTQLREEAEAAALLREAAEGELAELLADCVSVPREEYQVLLRSAAEARAREAASALVASSQRRLSQVSEVASPGAWAAAAVAATSGAASSACDSDVDADAGGGSSETGDAAMEDGAAEAKAAAAEQAAEAEAAERAAEVAALREQLAAVVGASVAESSRLGGRLRELQEELEGVRVENAALSAECSALRGALAARRRQAAAAASEEARAAAAAAEGGRAAAVEELQAARQRMRGLEAEAEAARKAAAAALADREALLAELATVRDAAVRATQALADCEARREAAEAAAAAAEGALAAANAELAALRREAVGARDLGALFKRDKLRGRRLGGLPLEWMAGWGSAGSSGERLEGEPEPEVVVVADAAEVGAAAGAVTGRSRRATMGSH